MKCKLFLTFFEFLTLWTFSAAAFPANDAFTNSVQFSGTNFTYAGNFAGATLEPGEPSTPATNTIWVSWAAPANGFAQVNSMSEALGQYCAVFTGPAVDHLQSVALVPRYINGLLRFIATEGTVYHFQFCGGHTNFTLNFQFQALETASNDNFASAQVIKGKVVYLDPQSVIGSTMELGEPAHLGSVPQKSLWWKWQAPQWGSCYFDPRASLATNHAIAFYTGHSVETVSLVTKSTAPYFSFNVIGGQTYYIAGAVPTNSLGDIASFLQISPVDSSVHAVPGNVLQEPSWEGTGILNAQSWKHSGSLGGSVNKSGGVDGTTWPALNAGTQIWQDFPTVPSHAYAIRFGYLIGGPLSGGSGDGQVAVSWDTNQIGISSIPAGEAGYWHWDDYTVIASNATSRITFQNLARNVEMDAFSVVDVSAPPAITTQPASISSFAAGTAAFVVGVTGTAPLNYQWWFSDNPLPGQTNKLLVLSGLTTNQIGNYFAIITNNFGAVTSSVASLLVDAPQAATILSQPYGDVIPVGGYFNLSVVAAGTPPLTYQWFLENNPIPEATNRSLTLSNVQTQDAGVYTVRVQNSSSSVLSVPASLVVSTSEVGGGTIDFRNQNSSGQTNANAPVFDLDGFTPLSGSNYVAQLYAGPSLALLRPVGQPSPFLQGFNAGYFLPSVITLGNVAPGSNAVTQVRAWDANIGTSYEEARAMGGRFGKSQILMTTVGDLNQPGKLTGLQSFSLQAGLPYLQVATITFLQRQPPNTVVWTLHGQAGNLYSIEKSASLHQIDWHPYLVVTNATGTVNFTDTANSASAVVFYRARILD